MLIKAEQRFVRMSPTKIRFVADTVRKVNSPTHAIALLEHVQKRAAQPVIKTLKQAVANAKNNFGLNPDDLVIRELMIGDGPTFKRWQPVSRGMAHPIAKKTAHIRVILEDRKKVQEVRKVPKVSKENEKQEIQKGGQVKSQKAKVKTTSKKLKA